VRTPQRPSQLRLLVACKALPKTLAALFRAVLLRRPHGIGCARGAAL
jgi:hypothetical protein